MFQTCNIKVCSHERGAVDYSIGYRRSNRHYQWFCPQCEHNKFFLLNYYYYPPHLGMLFVAYSSDLHNISYISVSFMKLTFDITILTITIIQSTQIFTHSFLCWSLLSSSQQAQYSIRRQCCNHQVGQFCPTVVSDHSLTDFPLSQFDKKCLTVSKVLVANPAICFLLRSVVMKCNNSGLRINNVFVVLSLTSQCQDEEKHNHVDRNLPAIFRKSFLSIS